MTAHVRVKKTGMTPLQLTRLLAILKPIRVTGEAILCNAGERSFDAYYLYKGRLEKFEPNQGKSIG